jgi:hypothetical protein
MSSIKGGEVAMLLTTSVTGSDLAAKDVFDGYLNNGALRTVASLALNTASSTTLLYLVDDGTTGYSTSTYLGGTTGQATGTVYSPPSCYASGKVSCWRAGLFAVSTDAVASDLQPASGAALTPGTAIYAQKSGGLLTASSSDGIKVGYFVEYGTDSSWVSTPRYVNGVKVPTEIIIDFRGTM